MSNLIIIAETISHLVTVGSYAFQCKGLVEDRQKTLDETKLISRHILCKVKLLLPLLENLENDGNAQYENFIRLKTALDNGLAFIEEKPDDFISTAVNIVFIGDNLKEFRARDEEINQALKLIYDDSSLSSALTDVTLTRMNSAGYNVEENQKKVKHIIATYRAKIKLSIQRNDPINYNIHRDIILNATTIGKLMKEREKLLFESMLERKAKNDVLTFFSLFPIPNQQADYKKSNLDITNQEIQEFYAYMFEGDNDVNLTTAFKRAVHCKHNSSIDKYFPNMKSEFYLRKLLWINSTQPMIKVSGEIQTAEKDSNFLLKLTTSLDNEKKDNHRSIKIQKSSSDKFSVAISDSENYRLGQFLKHHISDKGSMTNVRVYIKKDPTITFYDDEAILFTDNYYHLSVALPNEEKLNLINKSRDRRIKIDLLDPTDGSFRNLRKDENNKIIYKYQVLTDTSCFFDWANRKILTEKKPEVSISIKQLDNFLICFEENQVFIGEIEAKNVLIKEVLPSVDEFKAKIVQTIKELKTKFIKHFSQEGRQLNLLLSNLNYCDLKIEGKKTLIQEWIINLDATSKAIVQDIFTNYEKLDESDADSHFALLAELAFEANRARFLVNRNDSGKSMMIMERLTKAMKFLNEIEGKDLLLFVGQTGAGKSTSINYFSGVPLEKNTTKVGGIKVSANGLEVKHAAIGTLRSMSETVYVHGFQMLEELRKYFTAEEYSELYNFLFCDTPGFEDTRGLDFDLTAAVSLQRAIQTANSIKGLVIVIPESEFDLNSKGRGILEIFDKFSEMINCEIDKIPSEEKLHMYIIVSHCKDSSASSVYDSIDAFVSEYQKSSNASINSNNLQSFVSESSEVNSFREAVWKFIQEIKDGERLMCMDIEDNDARKEFLKKSYLQSNDGIPKERFRSFMDVTAINSSFSSFLSSSLLIWGNSLLGRFKNEMKDSLVTVEGSIHEIESNICICDDEGNFIESKQIECLKKKARTEENLQQLQLLLAKCENGTELGTLEMEQFQKIQETSQIRNSETLKAKETELIRKKEKIVDLENKVVELKTKIADLTQQIDIVLPAQIGITDNEISALKEGSFTEVLGELLPVNVGDPVFFRTLKPGVLKTVCEEVREASTADELSRDRIAAGNKSFTLLYHLYLEKNFRIVPDEKLPEFYQNQSVKTASGDFVAIFTGVHARILNEGENGIRPNAKPDGKSAVYTVEVTFPCSRLDWFSSFVFQPPSWVSPQFSLQHRVPNRVKNADKIEYLEDLKLGLIAQLTSLTIENPERKKELVESQAEITTCKADQLNLEIRIKELEKQLITDRIEDAINLEKVSLRNYENDWNQAGREKNNLKLKKDQLNQTLSALRQKLLYLQIEQLELAIVLLKDRRIAECWKEFAMQALSAHTNNPKEENLLMERCRSYVKFYDENSEQIFNECQALLEAEKGKKILQLTESIVYQNEKQSNQVNAVVQEKLNAINKINYLTTLLQSNWRQLPRIWSIISECEEINEDQLTNYDPNNNDDCSFSDDSTLKARLLAFGLQIDHFTSGTGNYFFNIFTLKLKEMNKIPKEKNHINVIHDLFDLLQTNYTMNKTHLHSYDEKTEFFCSFINAEERLEAFILKVMAIVYEVNLIIISDDCKISPIFHKPQNGHYDQIVYLGFLESASRFYPLHITDPVKADSLVKDLERIPCIGGPIMSFATKSINCAPLPKAALESKEN